VELLADYNVVVGTSDGFAIVSSESNRWITCISGSEQ